MRPWAGSSNSSSSSTASGRFVWMRIPPGPTSSVRASIILPVRRASMQGSSISERQLRRRSPASPTPDSMTAMVFYEPDERDRELLPHDPFKAFIAPRPIGWVSTLGPDGEVNLAPYSYFNAVQDSPPTLMFSSAGPKDSATFAGSGGEFVWNMPTYDLREQMNETSRTIPRGESEFERAGLEMAESRLVAPPRVAAAPVALECKVVQVVPLHDV